MRETNVSAAPAGANVDAGQETFDDAIDYGLLDSFIGFHLRLANDRTYENFIDRLGADSLRPGCFTILTLIANNPGITQIMISRVAGRDKSSVAKILRYMEDEGLIRRVRLDDDRRAYASYVTEAGAELNARLAEKARIQSAHLRSILGPEREAALLRTLKDLITALA
nr:MarR family winged helix-turn-helix transcriptional regulator [Pseudochelatococcus lubricantis]